ncbi:phospholipid-transporting ATPase ABCA1-like [Tribolium madens]|uniref:phospholipid-transporting ATPase ABCA1-like n=1 Tax=Tribolium madens TaxID=41895 RepID=UPI001CF75F95|nr:phospholipid-transporting ATPase ABCA1-like [Tribolium madens]XP_044266048.1 phospholipid-transporting ATPase ABCA1-like [Tribolium madens]XP_044266049.1 phospholipid-transporting ATPase ABCA1-like [Tribolium madens]
MFQHLKLILWKNLVIRKRHWLLTLTEILIPILLFTLVAYGRSKISGMNKQIITYPTYYRENTLDEIYSHLDVGELQLWYAPYNNFTENIIKKVQETFQIPGDDVREYTSPEKLKQHFQSASNCTSLITLVNFHGSDPKHLNYDLGFYDKYSSWDTDKLFVPVISQEDRRSSKYIYKGFAALQVAIDLAFLELQTLKSPKIDFSIQEFPDPPHTDDSGLSQLFIYFLPLITIFSFIFLCPAVLQKVGEEKHSGTKEFMKMVGMNSSMLWLGWFIHALMTNLFSIIVIVVLMKVPFWGVPYPPIEYSSGVVLFVFLFLYCMAAITFCFLVATIINKPSIATVVGLLIWIFSYFIPQAVVTSHENLAWRFKIPLALFPNMALHFAYKSISVYEMREVGIQWSNMFQSGSGGENDVTMGNVFVMLIVDMILFMLLTIYIENVKPGKYGIAQPYSFPLKTLKKCVKCLYCSKVENDPEAARLSDPEKCIEIIDLFKKFNNVVAVDNLNLPIYKNYITVLLGHNGAGKTTTMSILTGMINATNGSVKINGKDIKRHTSEVRRLLGLCPQHNLLFPDLTVFEHLKFFAMIKRSKNSTKEATEMLEKLGLEEKKYEMACTLSGGMKRKLCLGMALIGDSQVLILDEPTSGMDPESRRKVWNMLLEYRKTKTILITTHFMEEADVLGDYIAIMADGKLQDHDTPYNLKMKYNTGYHLSLMLKSMSFVKEITSEIQRFIPNATLLRTHHDSLVYLLPMDEKHKYKDVLKSLEEKNKDNWGIIAVGLSLTTLNDVFLKARDKHLERLGIGESQVDGSDKPIFNTTKTVKLNRSLNSFLALLVKRWYFFKKKFYWYFPAVIVSITIFLLAIWLGISSTDYNNVGESQLNLTLKVYDKSHTYFGGDNLPELIKMRKLYEEIVQQQGGYPELKKDVSAGIIEAGNKNIAFYNKHIIVAAEFNKSSNDEIIVNAMYNRFAIHAVPISINMAMNAALKALLNDSYSITTSNTPLKSFSTELTPTELSVVSVASVWVILIPMSMLFFVSNFIIFPNSEVSTHFLQLQIFAGIKTYFYWFTNIFFDFLFSIVPLAVLFVSLWLLNVFCFDSILFKHEEFETLMIICLVYVVSSLPFTYLLSHKKTVTGGFSLLLTLGIFTSVTPTIVIIAMEFSNDDYYINIAKSLKHVFIVFFPQFTLSYICTKFTKKFVANFNWEYMNPSKREHICKQEPNPCCYGITKECNIYESYLRNDKLGIQEDLLEMSASFGLYFFVLLLMNTEAFQRIVHFFKFIPAHIKAKIAKDSQKSINGGYQPKYPSEAETLVVKKLRKTYGPKVVVKDLMLQLKKNKCFGLLGVNGAGKSTTFRILTKSLFFDEGDVELDKVPIKRDDYMEKIGYCPQEDYLNYFLTGKEVVYSVARLKGYSDADAQEITKDLLKYFELEKYQDKPCSDYSGGNKRKLCSCLAFLGSPEVILLDEPTSGVDPSSRRNFWKIINSFKEKDNTSFLLCSHSMEECENLCDEIAIMKEGTIKDQGSLVELKNRYNKGYKITIKLRSEQDVDSLKDMFSRHLKAILLEEYAGSLVYQVKDESKRLSGLFTTLESFKTEFSCIDDYIVNQMSLEDIFLSVADSN